MTTENESELDDRQLSSLYKHAQQEMPSSQLDSTILSAAKKPLTTTPFNPFAHNWRISASLAAVLILTVGIVTLMDDANLDPVSGLPPLFIETDDTLEQSLSSISDESPAKQKQKAIRKSSKPSPLKRSKPMASAAPASAAEKLDSSTSRQRLHDEQKGGKTHSLEQSKQTFSRLKPLPANLPNLDSIKALRLAGNTQLANKKADIFIRYYFGNQLNKIAPSQVKLSTKDWKEIIRELRKLDRESIAIKLEKLLIKRLEN